MLRHCLGQALGLLVEADRGERHRGVAADLARAGGAERAGHRAHVGQDGNLLEHPLRLALTAGSRSVPDVACRTIWSELPEAAGKSCCSRLSARPDWVSGSWNWVEKLVPAARLAPKDPARATSHKTSTIVRWREHHLAMTLTSGRPFISGLPERLNDLNGLLRAAGGPLSALTGARSAR
jgi:hypothetical protein